MIANKGEKVIEAYDANGNPITSKWQGADVSKPLGGIMEMVHAGNRVTFDLDESGKHVSQIFNKKTHVKIPINETPQGYEFDMWVKVGKGKKEQNKAKKELKIEAIERAPKFAVIKESSEEDLGDQLESGFARLVREL